MSNALPGDPPYRDSGATPADMRINVPSSGISAGP